jgi:DUF4097 and DUF4098 domain-containing protein YvlB
MKQLLFLLAATVTTTVALAQDNSMLLTRKSLTDAGITRVITETSGGNIVVNGVTADARVEVYVRASNSRNSLSQAELEKKFNEEYELTLTTTDHTLTAIAKRRSHFGNNRNNVSVSFKIYVPVSVTTKVSTSGGNIDMAHLSGVQDFSTSGGNLRIDELKGKITGRTSGGNIHAFNCSNEITLTTSGGNIEAKNNEGKIDLNTSGGNVTLEGLKGTIDASTSGGNVQGANVTGELAASTSGGNVTLQDMSCSLSATTSGGHISVSMKALGSYVKLSNSGGNIALIMPANKGFNIKVRSDKINLTTPVAFVGQNEDGRMDGTINGGGIPVTISGDRVSLTVK